MPTEQCAVGRKIRVFRGRIGRRGRPDDRLVKHSRLHWPEEVVEVGHPSACENQMKTRDKGRRAALK